MDDRRLIDGRVLSVQVCRRHGAPLEERAAVRALLGRGLEGDIHGKRWPDMKRQVVLLDRLTLDAFGLPPGALREQITVDLPQLMTLPAGTRLDIGGATLEISGVCEPCVSIGERLGMSNPAAFAFALAGRRGMTARVRAVREDGLIGVGDGIAVTLPEAGARPGRKRRAATVA